MHAPINRWKRRLRPAVCGAAVLASLAAGGAVVGQPAAADPPAADAGVFAAEGAESDSASTVTLITGDRVEFDPDDPRTEPRITPAEGREHLTFHTLTHDGHVYVIPSDAQPLVDDGTLDRRLFDVAALIEDGLDDESAKTLPLMLTGGSAGITAAESIEGTDIDTVSVPKAETEQAWDDLTDGDEQRTLADGVDAVWLDGTRELQLDESVPQIGAPTAWDAGFTGDGVTVAVLDSGVDAAHPDLAGQIVEARDFTGGESVADLIGHGTHVASTIAGTGAAGGETYRGVAPDADLLIGKVCTDDECSESAVLAGMQWAAESGADVVNFSIGGPDTPELDPIEQAVNELSEQYGTLFVVAAGNSGNDTPVDSPGSADAALTVGAVDGQDMLSEFSNTGRIGDSGLKPDLTAPGVDITAARASGTYQGEPVDEYYTTASGTSMAAPHVAGAAALLSQQHPEWTGEQLKAALMGSAAPTDALGAFEQGAGRVDVAQSVGQEVYTEPASVSAGLMQWPHGDDEPFGEQVTYRNTGDTDVTLELALSGRGPDGTAAPEGMFALDATSLTVPAGGAAAVTLTIDTSMDAPDGRYSAYLIATGDGTEVTTPIGVDKEPERHNLTVAALGRDGGDADSGSGALLNLDTGEIWRFAFEGEPVTLRVPPGNYHVDGRFYFGDEGAHMIQPKLEVASDAAVTLDAREAGRIDIGFDNEEVVPYNVSEQYARSWAGGETGAGVTLGGLEHFFMGGVGAPVPEEDLTIAVDGAWGIPDAEGDFGSSPVMYQPVVFEHGQMPAGLRLHFADADMARIDAEYRAHTVVGATGMKSWVHFGPDGRNLSESMPVSAPLNRTEFLAVVPDGRWQSDYAEADLDVSEEESYHYYYGLGPWQAYEAGRTYTDAWNAAVIGPGLPTDRGLSYAERYEDQIGIKVPVFTDADAGRWGASSVDSGRTALYSGGELIGETDVAGSGYFDVPTEAAEYRLETEAVRESQADLSTRVSATWEFTSSHTDDYTALPLMAVKLTPRRLDADNTADRRWTVIDLAVETQDGPVEDVELELEASFDGGESWEPVGVCWGGGWVLHPEGEGYVSLRVTADDGDGNRVTQEIIRAYRYR